MHARIYDFTLIAGGMQRLPVVGDFFKVLSATGAINVNVDTGATLDLLPGQGLREFNFNTLTISDKSGAANAGKILVGFSGMVDDRVTGEVSVIDGGKARTIAGQAFSWAGGAGAVAGQSGLCQLQNPAGSGKRMIVKAVTTTLGAAGIAYVAEQINPDQPLAGGTGTVRSSKLVGSTAASIARERSGTVAGLAAAPKYLDFYTFGAAGNVAKIFQEPLVIEAGKGIEIVCVTANVALNWSAEWIEEAV